MGGSLSVFAERGCRITGVDIHHPSIESARELFARKGLRGEFICTDFFDYDTDERFDLVILHDALEHISDKEHLMLKIKSLLTQTGVVYLGFPAWQMPFGGHQQMACSRLLAHLPYTHLLPRPLFRALFRLFGEEESAVQYYFGLRETGISIERFEKLVSRTGYKIRHRQLWFINPNYQVKFGLKPRKLSPVVARIPYLRDFVTTTCYYLLEPDN